MIKIIEIIAILLIFISCEKTIGSETIIPFSDFLIGAGVVVIVILLVFLYMKWEGKKATTIYKKRIKKFKI